MQTRTNNNESITIKGDEKVLEQIDGSAIEKTLTIEE